MHQTFADLSPAQLRRQAETLLQQTPTRIAPQPELDSQRLIHELQVYQAELEIQNEELRHRQDELRTAHDRYAALYDLAPVGYLTLDALGTILAANLTAATLLGTLRSHLYGTMLARFIAREDQDTFYLYRRQVLETGTNQTCDLRMQRPDGTTFVACLESRRIPVEHSQGWQCLLTLSDITARKQTEEALQAARDDLEQRVLERTAALAQAYEDLKRFAYVVSHDLRAPLITLRGFARELQEACGVLRTALPTVVPHLGESQRGAVTAALEQDIPEALGFIHTAVSGMDKLIEAVLTLSRLERQFLHLEPVDLEALVHQLLHSLHYQIQKQQVRVTAGPFPPVHADRMAMEHIMSNLLSNAVTSLLPDRPGELRIWAEAEPEVTTVHVQDNGRGIAAADIPDVFEIFRRSGSQDVPGPGMGLASVRTLVRRHGGDVWCQSAIGEGTTFSFTLPHHGVEAA
jgi:PAS domain S-box-containing protein